MRRSTTSRLTLAAMLTAAGCATTTFSSTWKAPDAEKMSITGRKVAAVVMTPNAGARRTAEDALARELTRRGAQGVATYTFLSEAEMNDDAPARKRVSEAGIDGVVVMRVVSQDRSITYSPGTWTGGYYPSFWGYWGYGWGAVYSPGYLRTDTVVNVETLVYRVRDDKLIWAGVSGTTNPSKIDSFVKEIVDEAVREMKRAGLLPTRWEQP